MTDEEDPFEEAGYQRKDPEAKESEEGRCEGLLEGKKGKTHKNLRGTQDNVPEILRRVIVKAE